MVSGDSGVAGGLIMKRGTGNLQREMELFHSLCVVLDTPLDESQSRTGASLAVQQLGLAAKLQGAQV